MREVAALAGVSVKTVSRVFNDVVSVDPELVARTRKAADRLGFRPNMTASNLRRADGRTATIGLLLDDVGNPFSAAVHRAVEDVARPRGCLVLTGSVDEDPLRERELVNIFLDRQVDGLIIVPAGEDHGYLAGEQRAGTPVVFLDRPPMLLRADAVTADNEIGARAAVEHLLAVGHRRIAYLGDRVPLHTARTRYEGYVQALHSGGLRPDPTLVRHDVRGVSAAADAVTALLRRAKPPTALFTSQNLLTIGAVEALRAFGVHHQVALVGFDDFPLADALDPGVTVVAQNPTRMGQLAARMLFDRLDGTRSPSREVHLVPTQLIARGSGEIRATTSHPTPRTRRSSPPQSELAR